MSLDNRWLGLLVIIWGLFCPTPKSPDQIKVAAARKRPLTVADTIRTLRIAGPFPDSQYSPASDFAVFSPTGKCFVLSVSTGNLDRNTNDYSLLLFRTGDLPNARPRILATLSSSSNRAGISEIRWAKDGDTLYFLGSSAREATQLYSVQSSSGELTQLTHHSTSLESYAVSENGSIVYAAELPQINVITPRVLRYGFQVTTENLADLVGGQISRSDSELFVKKRASGTVQRLRTIDPLDSGVNDLYLSPNGRYLVVKTDATNIPPSWREYEDVNIQAALRVKPGRGSASRILHYELVNTRTGISEVLLAAPATYLSSDVLWAPDSRSLLLCGTYLPITVDNPLAFQLRRSSRFVVEIRLPARGFTEITEGDLRPVHWDAKTNVVQFYARQNQARTTDSPREIYYQKTVSGWTRLTNDSARADRAIPEIAVEQGLNLPPRIAVVDPKTNRKIPFWNLNPQFDELIFGKVEEIRWRDGNGDSLKGGLYLPPDYDPEKRYPLVIQTHGFDPDAFSMSGYYTTGFAAEPLACRGIVVLQLDDIFYDSLQTSGEAERAMTAYESAVHYLTQMGIVDPARVGIIGFSRTSFYVKYTLTHSTTHFAAAIVCDGFDAGYFQYLLFSNSIPFRDSEVDIVNGAPPFGVGISMWLKRSPGFLLDKVHTPVLIQAIGPISLLGEWEWFSGLRRLEKPVDLVYLPTGTHVLVKPWDRMVSQGGSVDWFCFWLKGEEDSDSEKAEQYAGWRTLRRQLASPRSQD
jgi:dipeptidyl aminopeptidase/acylaminoacyl peptidase